MDQMFQIMPNEAEIQSPCGLLAYQTKLGRILAGPSQEIDLKMGHQVIQHLFLTSNYPLTQIVSPLATKSQSRKNVIATQSNEIPMEKENVTASLQHPQPEASFSDAPTVPSGEKDKKLYEKDVLEATYFDLSLFWKLENFTNLDGVDAVELLWRKQHNKIARRKVLHTNYLVNR